jgi:hypothetical protein
MGEQAVPVESVQEPAPTFSAHVETYDQVIYGPGMEVDGPGMEASQASKPTRRTQTLPPPTRRQARLGRSVRGGSGVTTGERRKEFVGRSRRARLRNMPAPARARARPARSERRPQNTYLYIKDQGPSG